MTELSPAAKAVLDASTAPAGDFCLENVNKIAAAALRAAALELHAEEFETCGGCSYALMIEVDDLLAIANELEG